MKILIINKYYYKRGGTETYTFGLKKMLEKHGHEVALFCMKDNEREIDYKYSEYFLNHIDFKSDKLKNSFKLIYSVEAYKKLEKLIDNFQPDICHVNLIYHHITPSIFHVLNKYNIPIVFTAHDYKIICPNYKMWNNNNRCTKCIGGKYYNCLLNSCHKDSIINSALMTIEAYTHKILKSYDKINTIIAPSNFMRNYLSESGINEQKIKTIYNFYIEDELTYEENSDKGDRYILYFGRLSEEKGVKTFIQSKKNINQSIKYKIVGTGPLMEQLKALVSKQELSDIEFFGFREGIELHNLVKNAMAVVVPSEWDEVFGLTVLESFLHGKPVIATRKGAFPELIIEGKNGFFFDAGNPISLADCINEFLSLSEEEIEKMGRFCVENAKSKYNHEIYYTKLMEVYCELIEEKSITCVK